MVFPFCVAAKSTGVSPLFLHKFGVLAEIGELWLPEIHASQAGTCGSDILISFLQALLVTLLFT